MSLALGEPELGQAGVGRAGCAVGHQRTVVVHLAVNHVAISQRPPKRLVRTHDTVEELLVVFVIPLCQDDRAKVNVVLCRYGAVDDDRANQPTNVLGAVVGVVPGRAKLTGLENVAAPVRISGPRATPCLKLT